MIETELAKEARFISLAERYERELTTVFGFPLDFSVLDITAWAEERTIARLLSWLFSQDCWIPAVPLPPEMRDPLEWALKEVRQWLKDQKEKGQ